MKKYFLLILLLSCKVQEALLFPLDGGEILLNKNASPLLHTGSGNFIKAKTNFNVRSIENGVVKNIFLVDNRYTIFIQGKYQVFYSNLTSSYIKVGMNVKKGNVIGSLFSNTEYIDSCLSIAIKKDDLIINVEDIWKSL